MKNKDGFQTGVVSTNLYKDERVILERCEMETSNLHFKDSRSSSAGLWKNLRMQYSKGLLQYWCNMSIWMAWQMKIISIKSEIGKL